MPTSFVLLTVNEEKKHDIYNQMIKIPNVAEIHSLYGEYDLIVKISAESTEKLGNIVLESIQSLDGVTASKTIIGSL